MQHVHVHAHVPVGAHMQTETHVSCNCRSAATRTRHPICAPRTDARAPLIPSAFRPLCMRARFIARDESCAPLDTAHVGFGLGFAIDARTSSRIESGKTSRASCQPSRGEPPSWASGASTSTARAKPQRTAWKISPASVCRLDTSGPRSPGCSATWHSCTGSGGPGPERQRMWMPLSAWLCFAASLRRRMSSAYRCRCCWSRMCLYMCGMRIFRSKKRHAMRRSKMDCRRTTLTPSGRVRSTSTCVAPSRTASR
mmetsp:Transcript_50124/g.160944  ORF Transcript_50124/g.160944 Transcript_50124/m.160944 type:complete len:254 (+) Transcript_50124:77-838(+)